MNERTDTETASGGGLSDLRLVVHQVRYEQMAFWINRVGAVFTVGFSVVFLVLLGASAGNSRISYLGNIKLIQFYVSELRRLRGDGGSVHHPCHQHGRAAGDRPTQATPAEPDPRLGPARLHLHQHHGGGPGQVALLLVIGRFGYGVRFPASAAALVVVLLIGIASFAAMGVAMSTAIPNQETAGPVTSIVFFVLLFLSGLWYPLTGQFRPGQVLELLPRAPPDVGRVGAIQVPVRGLAVAVARSADRRYLGSRCHRGGAPSFPLGTVPELTSRRPVGEAGWPPGEPDPRRVGSAGPETGPTRPHGGVGSGWPPRVALAPGQVEVRRLGPRGVRDTMSRLLGELGPIV